MTRSYDRVTYTASRRAWATGDFRDRRWHAVYRIAAECGYIYPPAGTVHDDRDEEQPSQRAIIYAAMLDQPAELERIMRRSHSWSGVIAGLISHVGRLREDAATRQADVDWEKRQRIGREHGPEPTGAILRRALPDAFASRGKP